jgi:hypothetical protein
MRKILRLLLRVDLPKLIAMLPALLALLRRHANAKGKTTHADSNAIDRAFEGRNSDLIVAASATVIAVLPDDTIGDAHQRILTRLDSGLTLLLSHNIDLAPRVHRPQTGAAIAFKGEYEYNPKGGVVHWTHRDPKGWHEDGWVDYAGERYQ